MIILIDITTNTTIILGFAYIACIACIACLAC